MFLNISNLGITHTLQHIPNEQVKKEIYIYRIMICSWSVIDIPTDIIVAFELDYMIASIHLMLGMNIWFYRPLHLL